MRNVESPMSNVAGLKDCETLYEIKPYTSLHIYVVFFVRVSGIRFQILRKHIVWAIDILSRQFDTVYNFPRDLWLRKKHVPRHKFMTVSWTVLISYSMDSMHQAIKRPLHCEIRKRVQHWPMRNWLHKIIVWNKVTGSQLFVLVDRNVYLYARCHEHGCLLEHCVP